MDARTKFLIPACTENCSNDDALQLLIGGEAPFDGSAGNRSRRTCGIVPEEDDGPPVTQTGRLWCVAGQAKNARSRNAAGPGERGTDIPVNCSEVDDLAAN